MTYICAKLVIVAHVNCCMKSHRVYICVVLILYLKTMSLNNLKIMKKSPITDYSDMNTNIVMFVFNYIMNENFTTFFLKLFIFIFKYIIFVCRNYNSQVPMKEIASSHKVIGL